MDQVQPAFGRRIDRSARGNVRVSTEFARPIKARQPQDDGPRAEAALLQELLGRQASSSPFA